MVDLSGAEHGAWHGPTDGVGPGWDVKRQKQVFGCS